MPDTHAIARELAALGFSLIPIEPRGKRPLVAWAERQHRHATADELAQWFTDGEANIGILCGAISDHVVIDADSLEALRVCTRRFPYTPRQVRTARGWHLGYRHPGVPVRNRARIVTPGGRLALDVRGDGGYVVGPGSVHETGALYEFAGDWSEPAERIPIFHPEWLEAPPRRAPEPRTARPTGDLVERARRYLAPIPRPEIGQGSDAATLYAACRLVRGFGLLPADVEALLWEWAGNRPGWTRAWLARKVQHAERYGTEPVGALR